MKPDYSAMHPWENYSADIMVELTQSVEEGKDIESYRPLFEAVSKMPKDEYRARIADVIFDIVRNAPVKEGYAYCEPDALDEIRAARPACRPQKTKIEDRAALENRILGAWLGRICGCLLGKPVEGIRTDDFHPFLKATKNFPLSRYITKADADAVGGHAGKFRFGHVALADLIECMPVDDDTNYTVLAQVLVDKYGRDFTPNDVAATWLSYQPKGAYCTAERVAFCNLVKGYIPPVSAKFRNPYREWIGAQIRGDYFGYINPGDPEAAAGMAWRDASISHVKNGIYGEMFASAMIAQAAVEENMEKIILAGLSQIPEKSRLSEAVLSVIDGWKTGKTQEDAFASIHERFDEHKSHDWCHTVSNAMIVTAALLYGGGDYGKSICMAVQTGFDTDCNGATVGSVLGMRGGAEGIGDEWLKPVHGQLDTSIFGVGRVKLRDMAEKTMTHINWD